MSNIEKILTPFRQAKVGQSFKSKLLPLLLLVLLPLLFCLMLTGCTKQFSEQIHLGVICTSSVKPQSELLFLNEKGKQLRSIKFSAQGMFTIFAQPTKDQLVLPVTYSDEIIYVDLLKNAVQKQKTREYPFFYTDLGSAEFIIYNSDVKGDIDYLTYVLKTPDGEKSLRIKGFPLATAVHDKKAYIYLDKKAESDQILILDLQDFSVTDEITLKTDLAGISTLLYVDEKLLIPHSSTDELVVIPLKNPTKASSVHLPFATPHLIFEVNDQLVLLHYNGGISVLDKTNYQIKNKTQLPYNILRGEVVDGQIYLLVKNAQQQREIVLVNLADLQVAKTIEIKCDKDLLAQNFIVLTH